MPPLWQKCEKVTLDGLRRQKLGIKQAKIEVEALDDVETLNWNEKSRRLHDY